MDKLYEGNKIVIDVDANKQYILNMLGSIDRDTERLVKFLIESDYFVAPASTKHHLNCRGGLAQHSLNVIDALEIYTDYVELDEQSIILIGLLHDICKVFTYSTNYLKNGNVGKTPYKKFDKLPMGHGEKSLILANKLVDLTDDEMLAIRWHMGMFDNSYRYNQSAIEKSSEYVVVTHLADMFAAKYIDDLYIGDIE